LKLLSSFEKKAKAAKAKHKGVKAGIPQDPPKGSWCSPTTAAKTECLNYDLSDSDDSKSIMSSPPQEKGTAGSANLDRKQPVAKRGVPLFSPSLLRQEKEF
jgi:hypothetical protein